MLLRRVKTGSIRPQGGSVANVVVILNENGRVVAVEKRDATVARTAYVVVQAALDARSFRRGNVDADRSVTKRAIQVADRRRFADEIMDNPDFTQEQKEEWYALLSGRVFALDYFTVEVRPGAAAGGPVNGAPGGQPFVFGVHDP